MKGKKGLERPQSYKVLEGEAEKLVELSLFRKINWKACVNKSKPKNKKKK